MALPRVDLSNIQPKVSMHLLAQIITLKTRIQTPESEVFGRD